MKELYHDAAFLWYNPAIGVTYTVVGAAQHGHRFASVRIEKFGILKSKVVLIGANWAGPQETPISKRRLEKDIADMLEQVDTGISAGCFLRLATIWKESKCQTAAEKNFRELWRRQPIVLRKGPFISGTPC